MAIVRQRAGSAGETAASSLQAETLMARLVLVDGSGGSLAVLGAAMAHVEGAPGYEGAVARAVGAVDVAPVVNEVLAEVGIHMAPAAKPFGEPTDGDLVIAIGDTSVKADERVDAALATAGSPDLVVRSTARIMRDRLAREIAKICARRATT
jgi:hypothetical protein